MQQVNLYHPIFREERRVFSANTVGAAIGLVVVTLAALWAFSNWRLGRLEHELGELRAQRDAQLARFQSAGVHGTINSAPQIQQRIDTLVSRLARRNEALRAIESGEAGSSTGFATRLEALARGHQQGLWLEQVDFEGSALMLAGSALDENLVPRYLTNLSGQPALTGATFDHFAIERPKDEESRLRFEVSTVAPSARKGGGS